MNKGTARIFRAFAFFTSFAFLAAAYSFIETRLFKINRVKINNNGIKILHISDIHLFPHQKRKLKFIRKLKKEELDFIICTGDSISSNNAINCLIDTMRDAGFDKIPGAFVLGSNDYFAPKISNPFQYFFGPSSRKSNYTDKKRLDTKRLIAGLEFLGWRFAEETQFEIKIKNKKLKIAGSFDYHFKKNSDIKNILENSKGKNEITIGITHAPYLEALKPFLENNTNFLFAGHTHGSQIRLPKIGALVTNSDIPKDKASGVFQMENSIVSISEGLGTSAYFPFRFLCRPAVTILEI
ncbi:MAG: metallophosphoesterase [Bifidobacteriaceae bacterium]|jgi:predicted MPP superfamily phosphohydrolase|nr:metallophosphoesterase [Bifidobacteriaceae bacterium]